MTEIYYLESNTEQDLRDEVKDRYLSWHYFHQIDQSSADTIRTWLKYKEADRALKDYLVKHTKHIPIKSDPSLVIEDWMVTATEIKDD